MEMLAGFGRSRCTISPAESHVSKKWTQPSRCNSLARDPVLKVKLEFATRCEPYLERERGALVERLHPKSAPSWYRLVYHEIEINKWIINKADCDVTSSFFPFWMTLDDLHYVSHPYQICQSQSPSMSGAWPDNTASTKKVSSHPNSPGSVPITLQHVSILL